MNTRPHPIPTAAVGDVVKFKHGSRAGTAAVIRVATGCGWPCYLVATNPYPTWIGHEDLRA